MTSEGQGLRTIVIGVWSGRLDLTPSAGPNKMGLWRYNKRYSYPGGVARVSDDYQS
jgi:hypothetical protein